MHVLLTGQAILPALGRLKIPNSFVSWAIFHGLKRSGRESDKSSTSNSQMRMTVAALPLSLIRLDGQQRDNYV